MDSLQKAYEEKRRKFDEFDALPEPDQKRLRDQGLDPHERSEIRNARKRLFTIKYKNSLPIHVR